jgi:integrase
VQILAACPNTLAGHRDAALLGVGYDALARSSELTLLEVSHISADRTTVLIPRAKNDSTGQGRLVHFSPRSIELLSRWLAKSKVRVGPLFQGLHTGNVSGRALATSSIRRLVKQAAKRAELEAEVVSGLSGHSMRIGAAQDMMVAGLDHIAIMQAGGWTSVDVVARYVENAASESIYERRWQAMDHTKP